MAPASRPDQANGSSTFGAVILIVVAAVLVWFVAARPEVSLAGPDEDGCPGNNECVTIHTDSGDYVFTVEWAIEPEQRRCGLMFREEMAADHGMVFDFFDEQVRSFWMRNTLISLDMIFIRDGGEVLNIAENTVPLSLESVPSDGPARYVLEVIAGTAERIGLEPGDMIDLDRAPGMTEGTAICFDPPA